MWLLYVFKEIINMFMVGQVSWLVENFNIGIFSETINVMIYQTLSRLCDGTICWALPVHTTSSDLDYISRAQQYKTVKTENFVFLSDKV